MKRKIVSILIVLGLLVGLTAIPAAAQPTQDEVKEAIEKGVGWLLKQQNLDPASPDYGCWGHWEQVSVTGLAVKKLAHHAVDKKYGLGLDSPFDAPYAAQFQAGLNFLFAHATVVTIGTQTHDGRIDDPDGDGDGKGVYFDAWSHTYNTGIVLMAIAETTTPDRVVDVPRSPVNGWTYKQVAQDAADYLAWGQTDGGTGRGGWIYNEMDNASGWSDNSNTGYAVLGLQYAQASPPEGFALTIPAFVKTELTIWVNYIQCKTAGPNFGGSGYTTPCDWVNILKTGNLLKELAFIGANEDDARVKDALTYLHLHWDDTNVEPGWRGDRGIDDDGDSRIDEDPRNGADDDGDGLWDEDPGTASYQATYCGMKGLTSLGLHEFCDPPIDWQPDFETVLLAEQKADGSWPCTLWDYGYWSGDPPILSTLWALLTLQKVAPQPVMGRMTGGGSVFANGTRVTHGFELHCNITQGPNNLQVNWGKGNKFHLTDLTWARCSDDPKINEAPPVAGFDTYRGAGKGRYNGVPGATIEFEFTDAGEPGKSDTATIKIWDASGALVLSVSGKLTVGNHQAHAK